MFLHVDYFCSSQFSNFLFGFNSTDIFGLERIGAFSGLTQGKQGDRLFTTGNIHVFDTDPLCWVHARLLK